MVREASFWTAEKDAAAQALWRRGHSAKEVARKIGAPSQSAVIGRMWRLGAKRATQVALVNQRQAMGVRRAKAQGIRENSLETSERPRKSSGWFGPSLPLPQQTPVLCSPRPWLTREKGECAYPVAGEGVGVLSCCNASGRRLYCEAHDKVVHRKPCPPPQGATARALDHRFRH
jgi:hypothetical protein